MSQSIKLKNWAIRISDRRVVSLLYPGKSDMLVRSIIDSCYATAERILEENVDKLHAMADALMKYETLDSEQLDAIMEGREPGEPSDWGDDSSGGKGPHDNDGGSG